MTSETRGPERVWLQCMAEDYKDGWTWCWHDVGECEDPDVEYIRADIAYTRVAEMLEAEARQLWPANTIVFESFAHDAYRAAAYFLRTQAERGGT